MSRPLKKAKLTKIFSFTRNNCVSGPVANSFGDFWRTVWDQGVCVIVMVTNMIEGGRVGRT